MKKYSIFLLSVFFSVQTAFAQNSWSVLFGTEEFTGLVKKNLPEDLPEKIAVNSDGELFVSGTNNLGDGNPKANSMGAWVAKFNDKGQLLWYGVGDRDFRKCIPSQLSATTDGGAVLSGFDNGYNEKAKDALMLYKFDRNGKLSTKRHYTETLYAGDKKAEKRGRPLFTFQNSEGNISVIATFSVRVRTQKGNTIYSELVPETWLLNFGQDLEFISASVLEIPDISVSDEDFGIFSKFDNSNSADGSFAIVKKDKVDRNSLTVFKFDSDGNRLWTAEVGHKGTIYNYGITHTENGETALYYYIEENSSPQYLLKVYSTEGEKLSDKKLFNSNSGLFSSSLSKIIYSGEDIWVINNPAGGEGKIDIKKMNTDSKEYFSKTFGAKGSFIVDAVLTSDGGLATVSYTKDYNANYIDALIIKISKDGTSVPTVSKYTKAVK